VYSGLVRNCPIDFTAPKIYRAYTGPPYPRVERGSECFYEASRRRISDYPISKLDGCCARLPSELLLVSKSIHNEVSNILYRQNRFVLRGHTGSDLALLLSLSPKDLSSITSLLIRLNCCPCYWGHEGEGHVSDDPQTCHMCSTDIDQSDPELNSMTETGQALINQWIRLCCYLGTSISSFQLQLTIVCDCLDLSSGNQVSSIVGTHYLILSLLFDTAKQPKFLREVYIYDFECIPSL